ncbi:LysR family transcriptional activator of nhaA [Chitinivorax tropicus]|uniref:LysR family transcriptional activator of nhaA n=1 Tax=Chitinivorax tropicus TaxID=714531 RepID=A0A840MGY3_9PROT|nr:transcriptional activator NhaR [Chitinivorax tropicus]MBB5017908.1 LysR family transcriptional activator of nhaA [Chitinivorax tropicus]
MRYTDLNYKHLRYFWATAKEGSITKAAEQLGMSAQTVSGQIAQLEQQIGRALFAQQGRGLVLTEAGRIALGLADQIFLLGNQLQETLADEQLGQTLRFTVGISDALPKTLIYRLLEPALQLPQRIRLTCDEGEFDPLLADLALHRLDMVLADRPATHSTQLRLHSDTVAHCPVMIFAKQELAARHAKPFPACLHRAPMLMPTRNNALHAQLEHWFTTHDIRPDIVGEFEDSALLATFGQQGLGMFPMPAFSKEDMANQLGVACVGQLRNIIAPIYAIYSDRRILHPAVAAIRDHTR